MRKPKRRKPNPRHRAAVREKRRARAFWRLREQYRMETGRGYVAMAGVLVGLAVYLVVKLFT